MKQKNWMLSVKKGILLDGFQHQQKRTIMLVRFTRSVNTSILSSLFMNIMNWFINVKQCKDFL